MTADGQLSHPPHASIKFGVWGGGLVGWVFLMLYYKLLFLFVSMCTFRVGYWGGMGNPSNAPIGLLQFVTSFLRGNHVISTIVIVTTSLSLDIVKTFF